MKTKIFGGIVVLAIAAVFAWNLNVSLNSQNSSLSDIQLANIEALAQSPEGVDWTPLLYGCVPDERYTCTVYEILYLGPSPPYIILLYIDTFSGYKEE